MKKITFLFLALTVSISMMAQLQRTLPANIQAPAKQFIQQKETRASVKGNVYQDFELYTDFSLVFNPWSTADVEGSTTFGIDGFTFLHSNEAMAYIVFNPLSTTPPIDFDPALVPHGGIKYAACFAATTHQNNDWIISPKVEIGSNGHFKFWVKSYTDNYGLERYKVGVSTTNSNPSSFTFISGGSYLVAPAEAWELKDFDLSAYNGMDIYLGIQCVSDHAFIFMVDDIEITSESDANSTLTGKVSDAVSGIPIQNALVSVGGLSDNTDESGNYTITNIPEGVMIANFTATPRNGNAPLEIQFTDLSTENSHTVKASATGYTNYTNNQVIILEDDTNNLDIALSPTGQYRLVLTWGESPADLDSYLKTPPESRNLVSWNWNFGDGGTSTAQHPSHTYNSNGAYSVSLIVSDGFNNKIETRYGFITVGPIGVNETAWKKEINIYPNPVQDQLHITSGINIKSAILYDLKGQQILRSDNCGSDCFINLSSFPDGNYILQILTEKGSMQRKLNISR